MIRLRNGYNSSDTSRPVHGLGPTFVAVHVYIWGVEKKADRKHIYIFCRVLSENAAKNVKTGTPVRHGGYALFPVRDLATETHPLFILALESFSQEHGCSVRRPQRTSSRLRLTITNTFTPLPSGEAHSSRGQRPEIRCQLRQERSTLSVTLIPSSLPYVPLFHPRHPQNPRLLLAVKSPSRLHHPAKPTRPEVRGQRSDVSSDKSVQLFPLTSSCLRYLMFPSSIRVIRKIRGYSSPLNHPHAFTARRSPLLQRSEVRGQRSASAPLSFR